MTKSTDVKRAWILIQALTRMDAMDEQISSVSPIYPHCVLRIDVGTYDLNGDGDTSEGIVLDAESAAQVLSFARRVIKSGLINIGIEINE